MAIENHTPTRSIATTHCRANHTSVWLSSEPIPNATLLTALDIHVFSHVLSIGSVTAHPDYTDYAKLEREAEASETDGKEPVAIHGENLSRK
jgi:hypothetical protein